MNWITQTLMARGNNNDNGIHVLFFLSRDVGLERSIRPVTLNTWNLDNAQKCYFSRFLFIYIFLSISAPFGVPLKDIFQDMVWSSLLSETKCKWDSSCLYVYV